jgi:hypothetical protein
MDRIGTRAPNHEDYLAWRDMFCPPIHSTFADCQNLRGYPITSAGPHGFESTYYGTSVGKMEYSRPAFLCSGGLTNPALSRRRSIQVVSRLATVGQPLYTV